MGYTGHTLWDILWDIFVKSYGIYLAKYRIYLAITVVYIGLRLYTGAI